MLPTELKRLNKIPHKSGVYIMKDAAAKINYVGKARDLNRRVASYFSGQKEAKINLLLGKIRKIDYIVTSSEREALILEDALIKKFKPFYNVLLRDDKSFPFIKLSSPPWPTLSIARIAKQIQKSRGRDHYYGPYTSNLKHMVQWLREVFALRRCGYDIDDKKKDYSGCLYLQTNKCSAPCVGKISKSEYMKNVARSKIFLQGNFGKMKNILTTQMSNYSQKMEFEKAGGIKKIIESLGEMSEKIRFQELDRANIDYLTSGSDALSGLQTKLTLKNFPSDIDAIDISNFGTTDCVGAGVRFHMGEPDKANYRKYKVKTVKGQNDFTMIEEVVKRRYSRHIAERLNMPDMLLIDGGEGQLSAAMNALKNLDLLGKIDVISLSKGSKGSDKIHAQSGRTIILERGDAVLALLQRIRDEAHRFAISYHRCLRAKKYA